MTLLMKVALLLMTSLISTQMMILVDHKPVSKSWLCKEFRTKKKLRNKRMYRLC